MKQTVLNLWQKDATFSMNTNYCGGSGIIYNAEVLKVLKFCNFCDYNDAYILVRGTFILGLSFVMPIYNLMGYSSNFSEPVKSLCFY